MDLEKLRIFVAAADAGGFSQAARQLYISHSTVSRSIAALERDLGVTLIERSCHSFALTAAGRQLYTDALAILSYAEAAIERVKAANAQSL